jgi:hypothetical protein
VNGRQEGVSDRSGGFPLRWKSPTQANRRLEWATTKWPLVSEEENND